MQSSIDFLPCFLHTDVSLDSLNLIMRGDIWGLYNFILYFKEHGVPLPIFTSDKLLL